MRCYATSIWDATLYKAWSNIVHTIVPDVRHFEASLSELADMCSATEVVLFEKATFLVMSHYSRLDANETDATKHSKMMDTNSVVRIDDPQDSKEVLLAGLSSSMLPHSENMNDTAERHVVMSDDRFERVSELVKQFKLSCLYV